MRMAYKQKRQTLIFFHAFHLVVLMQLSIVLEIKEIPLKEAATGDVGKMVTEAIKNVFDFSITGLNEAAACSREVPVKTEFSFPTYI